MSRNLNTRTAAVALPLPELPPPPNSCLDGWMDEYGWMDGWMNEK